MRTAWRLVGLCLGLIAAGEARGASQAVVCVDIRQPFVAGVTNAAVLAALRARVSHKRVRVMTCDPARSDEVTWRVELSRRDASTITIAASGKNLAQEQSIGIDPADPADAVRQAALVAAELMEPALIAWSESEDALAPIAEEPPPPVATAIEPEAPAPEPPSTPVEASPHFWLGARTGTRLRRDSAPALDVGVVGFLRYRHWRAVVDVAGDFWSSDTQGTVTSRLTELELGATLGHDFFADRLFVGLGAEARRTFATLSSDAPVQPSLATWEVGVRAATTVAIWRGSGAEVGLSTQVAWWHAPLRLLFDGQELRHQAHLDLVLAPYLAIRLQ